jgi:hypothetical protein
LARWPSCAILGAQVQAEMRRPETMAKLRVLAEAGLIGMEWQR